MNQQRGYSTDDARTVEDLLELVLGILRDAPDLADADVYVAGESYAGVYVPLLARRILRHNRAVASGGGESDSNGNGGGGSGHRRRGVRLVGYVVGNGVTDDDIDGDSQVCDFGCMVYGVCGPHLITTKNLPTSKPLQTPPHLSSGTLRVRRRPA
jgi:hypothetical protein